LNIPSRFPKIYLSCNFTINILNAYYYDRIADWWESVTAATPFENHLETTFVNDPGYMSMSLLPQSAKEKIKIKLEKFRAQNQHRPYVKYNIKRILTRLNLQPETSLGHFFEYIHSLDSIRGTNYAQIFPEVFEMLRPYDSQFSVENSV
jgi:hypothetical protein